MEIGNWIGWVLAFVATVFAIRATVRFDLNEWLNERRNQKKEQLRSLCPHVHGTYHEGQPAVRSTFISPPGTTAYQCQDCHYVTHDRAWVHENAEYWANNPVQLIERTKQIEKLTKSFLRL